MGEVAGDQSASFEVGVLAGYSVHDPPLTAGGQATSCAAVPTPPLAPNVWYMPAPTLPPPQPPPPAEMTLSCAWVGV